MQMKLILKKEDITHHQQEGRIMGGNVKMAFGRAYDYSVPADGREEL